ncbi:MAG: hypothetical protein AAGJ94_02355 [Pseudomonadota bacterium]
MFHRLICLVAVLFVAACQSPIVEKTGPITIVGVDVERTSAFQPTTAIAAPLQKRLDTALMGRDAGGQPVVLDVTLTKIAYKDPLAAAVVGSSNQITSVVSIRDEAGREIAQFPFVARTDTFPQGIAGAIQAAAQDKAEVDDKLTEAFAKDFTQRLFGKTPAKRAAPSLPPITPREPAAEAAPTS